MDQNTITSRYARKSCLTTETKYGGVRALTIETIVALPTVSVPPQ